MKLEKSYGKLAQGSRILALLNSYKIDFTFVLFVAILCFQYNSIISMREVPGWDPSAYLANARNWMTNTPLYETFRPPLISWLIVGIWMFTGENWSNVKWLQVVFTIGAGIILYITLRRHQGSLFALGVTGLVMLNIHVFLASSQILTEGLSLFFVVATLYFLKSEKPINWFLAGIMIGLTFASRYPIILQSLVIFIVESLVRKDWKLSLRTIVGAVSAIITVVASVYIKTGTFQTALPKDTVLTFALSTFYLEKSLVIWGVAILLVPLAFFFRGTYADRYNYSFIAWFIVSLLFWSANSTNHQFRFAIQFMPAAYYLAILAIENIVRGKIALGPRANSKMKN